MHATIMYIVGLPLTNCLKTLRKNNTKRTDIEPLISNLKQYVDFRRRPYNPCPELQTWRATQGALKHTLRLTFQSLIMWGSTINPQLSPPHYNPRLILIAECVLGAPTTLSILLEELKAQTEMPNGAAAVALDIATALICTPKSENSPVAVGWVGSAVPAHPARRTNRLNLRDALRLEFDAATDLIQKDQTMAETVVRLHRSVETQLNMAVAPIPDIAAPMPTMLPDLGMSTNVGVSSVDQNMDFGTDNNSAIDLSGADAMQLDLTDTLMSGDMKMGSSEGLFGADSTLNNDDDDVFGGLEFNLDGMDDNYYQ